MTTLIRFYTWVFDKNEIAFVQVKPQIENDNEYSLHEVIIKLKSNQLFTLVCANRSRAEAALDELTASLDPGIVNKSHNHYLAKQIHSMKEKFILLQNDINTLMRSYSRAKNKEKKKLQ